MKILDHIKCLNRSQWLHYFILGLSALVVCLPNFLSFLPSAFFDQQWKKAEFLLNIEYFQRMSEFVASVDDSYARQRYHCYLSIVQVIFFLQLFLAIYAASIHETNDPKPFFESFQRLFWLNFLWVVLIANGIFFEQFNEMRGKRYGFVFIFNYGSFVLFILSISFSSMIYRVTSAIRHFINDKNSRNSRKL